MALVASPLLAQQASPAPPNLEELRKKLADTKWKGDDGGFITFAADKSVTTSWGTRGEWKLVNPHLLTIKWGKGKLDNYAFNPATMTYTKPNGIKVHLQP